MRIPAIAPRAANNYGERVAPDGVWYFAYGSNMQSATLRGRRGIVYRRAVAGELRGWRLVVDKPPLFGTSESFANIVRDRSASVWGVLFDIDDADLAHIDLTEGVLIGNYQRIAVDVIAEDGRAVGAHTLTSERRDASLRPSTRYMELLIAGAVEHRLPASYVEMLQSIEATPPTAESLEFRAMMDSFMRRG